MVVNTYVKKKTVSRWPNCIPKELEKEEQRKYQRRKEKTNIKEEINEIEPGKTENIGFLKKSTNLTNLQLDLPREKERTQVNKVINKREDITDDTTGTQGSQKTIMTKYLPANWTTRKEGANSWIIPINA